MPLSRIQSAKLGAASERGLAWAALQDFWDQAPQELVAALPSGYAELREGLVGAPTDEETGHRVGRAWLHLLEGMAERQAE